MLTLSAFVTSGAEGVNRLWPRCQADVVLANQVACIGFVSDNRDVNINFAGKTMPRNKKAEDSADMNGLRTDGARAMVSMKDVAAKAGVSLMTVSRVLSSPELVAEETRKRVLQTIETEGYVPNAIAGSHGFRLKQVVGLCIPSIRNSLFANTVQAISTVLARQGYSLLLTPTGWDQESEERAISTFMTQRPAGIILHNTTHTERARDILFKSGIPVVETGDLGRSPIDMLVSYSNFKVAKAITTLLIDKGYRRIGIISLPLRNNERGRERLRGYQAALKGRGLSFNRQMVVEGSEGYKGGTDAFRELVDGTADLDAVFCAGDVWAVAALLECQRRGWDVPKRIALAGIDVQEHDVSNFIRPAITNARIPRAEIGARAATLMIERLQGRSQGAIVEDVGFAIDEGATT